MPNLPDITEVEPLSEKDEPLIQEVIAVLRKHDGLDRFGLMLLHQHFDLSPDEVLVECTDLATRTQVIKPTRKAEAESVRAVGTAWRLDSGQARTFCMCLNGHRSTGDAIAMPVPVQARAGKAGRIPQQFPSQPDVLEARWNDLAKAKRWDECAAIAAAISRLAPERSFGWIHRSFALHELKRTQEAFDQLLAVADKFANVWIVPYNLACYCAQLGRLGEGREWLMKAMTIDERTVLRAAVNDPDVKPVWDSMSIKL